MKKENLKTGEKIMRSIFENDYPGKQEILEKIIKPIFVKAKDTSLTSNQELLDSDKKQIKAFSIFAQVKGMFPITFADIELNDNVNLKNSRVAIQNCVRRVLQENTSAIIFFHYEDCSKEWRISFVNRGDTLKESTNAKRFTYLCGKNHACKTVTANFEKLLGIERIKDTDLIEAFSVEPLSNEFFTKYREIYSDFVEYITGKRFVKQGGKFVEVKNKNANPQFKSQFNENDKDVRDYVKKMMGRLVFLHFLQKKGWLGVKKNDSWENGDKKFIQNLFVRYSNSNKNKNDFLESALEPLFFKTLNENRGTEAIAPKEITDIYGEEIRIPYLNGGLFEEDELDKKNVKFKDEQFKELLDFFGEYNFTIDETDPDEQEIGVDPEMLGKIFENLLEDNKDKGAFYTPKEIVSYMCRESLIAYLESKIAVVSTLRLGSVTADSTTDVISSEAEKSKTTVVEPVETKIRDFVLNHKCDFNQTQKKEIDEAIKNIKICDPAVGSGAFPMGMLNELYACRYALNETESAVQIKKEIVKNNIYGVDIEKGAIDIARLRFWLSIVVDEKEPLPLPNLDYKLMQGNSLLESFEGIDLSDITKREIEKDEWFDEENELRKQTNALIDSFEFNMKEYFDTNDHKKKQQLKEEINEFVKLRVLNTLGADNISMESKISLCDSKIKFANQSMKQLIKTKNDPMYKKAEKELKLYTEKKEALLKEKSSLTKKQVNAENAELDVTKYFLWHTWFNDVFNRGLDCNGFDVVIGNPPYIKEYTNKSVFDGFRESSPYYKGKMDLWYGFACFGIDLLCKNGLLCFIAQNNWTTSEGASIMRNKVIEDTKILQMVDFNTYMIFENADIQTMVMLFQKNSIDDNYTFDHRKIVGNNCKMNDIIDFLRKNNNQNAEYLNVTISRKDKKDKLLTFSGDDSLLDKIAKGKLFLLPNEATNGIHTHHDSVNKKINLEFPDLEIGKGIFVLTENEKKNLNLSSAELNLLKPYFLSDEIGRFYTNPKNKFWIIYTDSSFKNKSSMTNYPNLKKHLDFVGKAITSDNKPYGLHRAREEHFFKNEKIVSLRKCVGKPCFSYNDFDCYVPAMYYVIQTNRWNMKFLTGLFNSKLVAFWLKNKGKMQGENFQVDKAPLLEIPIPKVSEENQKIIANIVDEIITQKKQDKDTQILESQIDTKVYELYRLTEDEIKIVES